MGAKDKDKSRKGVEARLKSEGWIIVRKGPGDHVQYKHPGKPGRVTIDTGAREIPKGTLRSIYNQARWDW